MASRKTHCAVQAPSTLCGLVNQIFALSATHDVGNQVNRHHRRFSCLLQRMNAFYVPCDDWRPIALRSGRVPFDADLV